MAQLNLFLFGAPRIEFQNVPLDLDRRKALALITYLAVADQPQGRDSLAAMFWPTLDQSHARAALRSTLPTLTTLLPDGILVADRMTIMLNYTDAWIDVREFLALLVKYREHNHPRDEICEVCYEWLVQAAALYRDEFLAGFSLPDSLAYDEWQLVQREWLRREFEGVLQRLARYCGQQQRYDEAIAYAQRWLALDPLHETAHRLLMNLYNARGQRTEALRQYQECVRLLDEELSTPPDEETTRLYEAIKSYNTAPLQDSPATTLPSGTLPPRPPLIIGREDVLEDLKIRLGIPDRKQTRPITIIQGWPGVGKSTIMAALAHDPDIARAFPGGVLWAFLGEEPSLLTELARWADSLNVLGVERSRKPADISAQLTAYLRDTQTLLLVDDVWQAEHALPFRVGGQGSALVLTTRLNNVAQALAATPKDVYKLSVLAEDKALQLLQALAPDAVVEYPVEAQELVHDLEGLPLALQVAGRLLHRESRLGWGLKDLLVELRSGANLLTAEAPFDMLDLNNNTKPTIAALLQRSIDSLDSQTRERFAYLSLFAPKPATFDLDAMGVAWEIEDPKPTARILVNHGLLEPVGSGRFQMHALLVIHARAMLASLK